MKFRDLHFLSKSNIRGNKSSRAVTVLICLLVSAVTLISSYTVVTVNVVNSYKKEYRARVLDMSPFLDTLTEEVIAEISSVEHVEYVTDEMGMEYILYIMEITESDDAQFNEQIKSRDTSIIVHGLFENEKKSVIKGKSLEDAPVFSCLVPSIFYPFSDDFDLDYKNLDYIDGTTLIGKTITIQGNDGKADFWYYKPTDSGYNEQVLSTMLTPEITLEIVGVYPCSRSTSGSYTSIFVSKETKMRMCQMYMEATGIDLSGDSYVAQYWNDPSLHTHLVVVDDYSNIPEVFNAVAVGLDYPCISSTPMELQDETAVLCANLFKTVGAFLIVAIVCVSVMLLVQSSTSAIRERKGYIGLMKAIGYKNRQVFLCLMWEQLYLSLRAFFMGAVISSAAAFLINLYMEHGTFSQMQYVMDWKIYLVFLGISFLITLLIPLITELLLIRKLVKIEPKEAMNAK